MTKGGAKVDKTTPAPHMAFDFGTIEDSEPRGSDTMIQDYVTEIINRIPTQGDRARIELVGYCYNNFNFEAYPGDKLTPDQRATVDAFVASYALR